MKKTQDALLELKQPETLDEWLNTPLDNIAAINRFKWKSTQNTIDIGSGYCKYDEAVAIFKKEHGDLAEKEIRDAVHNNKLGIYLLIKPEQDVTSKKMQEIELNDEYKSVNNINYEKRYFSMAEDIYFERLMPKIACELLREGELVANVIRKRRVVNFHPTAIEKKHSICCNLAERIKVQHHLDQGPELKPRPNINMNEVYLMAHEIESLKEVKSKKTILLTKKEIIAKYGHKQINLESKLKRKDRSPSTEARIDNPTGYSKGIYYNQDEIENWLKIKGYFTEQELLELNSQGKKQKTANSDPFFARDF